MRKVRRKDGGGGVKGRREGGRGRERKKREEEESAKERERKMEREENRKGRGCPKKFCGESKLKKGKVLTLRNLVLAELAASLKSPSVSIQLSLMAEMHSSITTAISHLYARR